MNQSLDLLRSALGLGALFALLCPLAIVAGQESPPTKKEETMTKSAQGRFDIEMKPLAEDKGWGGFARMSIDKVFHGELEGESKGVMLAAHTEVKGSAGYVAFERVTGKLDGQSGSFVLQHSGSMGQGKSSQVIEVVPDSGTGELKGISGSLEIIYKEKGHDYVFSYSL